MRGVWKSMRGAALLGAALCVGALAQASVQRTDTPERQAVQQALSGLAVPFEQNQGQFDPQVAFMAKTFAGSVFVTRDGRIVYSLPGQALAADAKTADAQHPRQPPSARGPGWVLSETLIGAQPLQPQGTGRAATHVTRFKPQGAHQASTWQSVHLGQAWPGVEVELSARGNNVEKLFHVAPGADPAHIGIALEGAQDLRLGAQGQLIASTGNGDVAYTAPIAWQDIAGQRVPVGVRYALKGGDSQARQYGFVLEGWDPSYPLTIDPLIQSTYLGGSDWDEIRALALAANGDVLVGGETRSLNLPRTAGGAQADRGGGYREGFVARLSGDLQTLVQSTYLGGGDDDVIRALALDPVSGDVLVGGSTRSTDLPGTTGGAQAVSGGLTDVFVTRLSGNLQTLVQSTYLGGSSNDIPNALALDSATGDVLVGGDTYSTDLPGSAGGAQAARVGTEDGFVARLSGDLQTLVQSTYLGGSGSNGDIINALAMDSATGDVLVGGATSSSDLPGTTGGAQPTHVGGGGSGYDGFVARLSGDLKTLVQSTYLGGGEHDNIYALALDSATGDVLVGGYTYSSDLPGTAGGAQATKGGDIDNLVARLSGDLKTLVQSTYLGGGNSEDIYALALDSATGDVLVGGFTNSSDLPGTIGGAQPTYVGGVGGLGYDGFVARLSGNLRTLVQSTYLGGSSSGDEVIYALALDSVTGDVLVGGRTAATDLPGTAGGAQSSNSGGREGFVARLTGDLKGMLSQTITFPPQSPTSRSFVAGDTFPIDPLATATSGLPVSYASGTPDVCTVSGTAVTMVAVGTCTLVASQAGDAGWLPAADVSQNVTLLAAGVAAAVTPIPTLSTWMLLALAGLLGLAAGLRRRG